MNMLLTVALGGAIGSVSRYVVAARVGHVLGTTFPWGTLAVNVAGGLIIGLLAGIMAFTWSASHEMRGFLVTGVLGGFTTFSAFSLEVVNLIERGAWGAAGAYIVLSVALSVGAVLAGLWFARLATG